MMRLMAVLLIVAGLAASPARAATAILATLDKVTAEIGTLEAKIDDLTRFGTLDILVRSCRKKPPEEPPETAAFVQIVDNGTGGKAAERIFSGWMFASSPGLNALEHPVYDVWLIDCSNVSGSGSDGSE